MEQISSVAILGAAQGYTDEKIGNLFDPFSESKAYTTGEYVIYNNSIYEFIADKSAGPWDATKVRKTNFSDVTEGKEDKTNKVTAFSSPTDTQYPSAKLVSDSLAPTLKEPSSGIAVGKYFRVASIDSNGHPVLEYVDGSSGSDKVLIATYGTSTATEVASALTAGKIVVTCYTASANEKHWLQLIDETNGKYVFAESSVTTADSVTTVTGVSAALSKTTNAWELLTGGASVPTFPATIENGKYLHTNATTGALEWVSIDDTVTIVSLTDGTETSAQLVARLSALNTAGKHVFFDVSTLQAQMYLCTIYFDSYVSPTKYRVTDLVTGKFCVGAYTASKTLSTILSEAIEEYVSITVTCTTQDSTTVTGQTVTLREGSATGTVKETLAYNGQPVTFVVAKGFEYHVSVSDNLSGHFNPTTASGTANTSTSITLTYSDASHVSTFSDVASAVAAGAGNALVGVEIADTWTATNGTEYSDPMVVMSVETVEDEDGETHTAAIMRRKYATLDSVQFDAPEQVSATGETYASGTYYYLNNSGTLSLLVEGTDYQVGDTVGDNIYKNSIRDTSIDLIRNGYNRYRDSGIRQWLKSNAAAGSWWTSTHVGDVAPSQLSSIRGYKAGCSSALLNAIKTIKIQCYTNTVTDGGAIDTMYDDLWLPSGTQVYGSVNDNEGTYWKWYKDATGLDAPSNATNEGRIHYALENHSSSQHVRLRSAHRSHSYNAWSVNDNGYVNNTSSNNAYRCVPACAIY